MCNYRYSDLPSWVPDWQLSKAWPLFGMKPDRFKACEPLELFYEILENSYLHLKGFYIGCATSFPPLRHTCILLPRILEQHAADIGSTYLITGEPSMNALIRIMVTDGSGGIHYAWEWINAKEEEEGLPMPTYQDSEFPDESESHDRPTKRAVLFSS